MDTLKYEVTDRHNSLQKYDFFLKNMGVEATLKELAREVLEKRDFAKIFDLGCGDAGALSELKKVFGKKIVVCGVDALGAQGLDWFVRGNALIVGFPKNCDLVFSFRTLHEIANLEKIFEKISDCMASGAKAFLSIRCQQLAGNKIVFHGNLEKKDTDFLKQIEKKQEFNEMKVLVIKITQSAPGNKEFIAGANVFLSKI